MPLTRQQKEAVVAEASEALSAAVAYVFVAFDALTVSDSEELREQMAAAGVQLRVLPKRLLSIALKQLNIAFDPREHDGQLAVAWSADPVAPAKILATFIKTRENVRMVSGVMDGALLSAAEVQALALLPSRHELLGILAGTLAAPMSGLVRVLSGVPRSMVYVLTAVKDQKAAAA